MVDTPITQSKGLFPSNFFRFSPTFSRFRSTGFSLESNSVKECRIIRAPTVSIPIKNAAVRFPFSSHRSITLLITKEKTMPPKRDIISFFAVNRPRRLLSTNDMNQLIFDGFTTLFKTCPKSKNTANNMILVSLGKENNGTAYISVKKI